MAGILRRLDRAQEHLNELEGAIRWWVGQNPEPWTGHTSDDRTQHHFHLSFNTDPDIRRWGILFGESVHCLRSALDDLAWECASRHGDPPEWTQFPIFIDRDRYFWAETRRGGGQYQIIGIKDASVRALIERFQPWQRRQRPDLHSLWVVHEFDRKDKHRVITPVAMAPQQIETNVTLRYVDEATARTALPPVFAAKDSPLENNAEFLTVYTPSAPVEVKMHHGITLGIGISHEGITGGVTGTLGHLYKDVRGVVEEFLDCLT